MTVGHTRRRQARRGSAAQSPDAPTSCSSQRFRCNKNGINDSTYKPAVIYISGSTWYDGKCVFMSKPSKQRADGAVEGGQDVLQN